MLGPRSIPTAATSLQHQKSTKLLISRYESLVDNKPVPLRPPAHTPDIKKSPIRQSFRNLLAVIKKGVGKSKLVQRPATPSTTDDPFTVSTKAFPGPQLAGSLFYLARSPGTSKGPPPILPVWTFCSAVLEGDTVHLTWPTTPSTHTVLLKHCTDVRSLTPDQLDLEEKALLPGDAKDFKVFEVLIDGHGVEKFATTTVRERARWVSAIWEVIVPSTKSSDIGTTSVADADTPADESRPSTICVDRPLPPVPERAISTIQPDHSHTPTSPSIYPPSQLDSLASPTVSRPRSPSIAKLGHLSVVRQRLAQIEAVQQQPQSAPSSPCRLYRNSSLLRTKSLRIQTQFPASPVSPTRIMESYAAKHQILPAIEKDHEKDHEGTPVSISETTSVSYAAESAPQPLLTDIHQMISGIAWRTEDAGATLDIIQNKMDQSERSAPHFETITQELEDIHRRLRSDLPGIVKSLAEIQTRQADTDNKEDRVNDTAQSSKATAASLAKLNQILEILQEEAAQRSLQTHQQTDSVRYLNELNSWLEAFVSGGTAQIQVVAAGVEKLCHQFGCSGEKTPSGRSNIVSAVQQLISEAQTRDHSTAALQHSVNNLAAVLGSESRFTPEAMAGLIDQQRQDQEGLLRALAAELSSEIRGERLRFVDAMKEATAINVQMHVEQLKAELASQVRADLFAHYSKQKPPPVSQPPYMYAPPSRMGPPTRTLPNPQYGGHY